MLRRLTEANLRSDPAIMGEVLRLLDEVAGAWEGVAPAAATTAPAATAGESA